MNDIEHSHNQPNETHAGFFPFFCGYQSRPSVVILHTTRGKFKCSLHKRLEIIYSVINISPWQSPASLWTYNEERALKCGYNTTKMTKDPVQYRICVITETGLLWRLTHRADWVSGPFHQKDSVDWLLFTCSECQPAQSSNELFASPAFTIIQFLIAEEGREAGSSCHWMCVRYVWNFRRAVSLFVFVSPALLNRSEGKLSTPGDFPAFRLCIASTTSSLRTGRLSARFVGSSYSGVGWCPERVRGCVGHRSTQSSGSEQPCFVRTFSLMSSLTADLGCWALERALRVL